MQNPIKRILKEKKLTVNEFAILTGVGVSRVYHVLKGFNSELRGNILNAIEGMGYDKEVVKSEYLDWLKVRKEEIKLEKLSK